MTKPSDGATDQPAGVATVIRPEREDLRVAALAALAVAVHVMEAAVPAPVPGIKPGLANVVTVLALVRFGWATAAWIGALRVLVGSLLLGTFLSPTFLLSAAGAAAALAALALGARWPGRGLSPLGLSLLAAVAHMAGQVALAWALFVPHQALLLLAAPLVTAAAVFGTASGIIACHVLEAVEGRAGT